MGCLCMGGGGCSGYKLTDIHRKKLSDVHKGREFTEETRQLLSKSKRGILNPNFNKKGSESPLSKTYTIIHPDGYIETIQGLKHFCRKYNICPSKMIQVFKGKRKHHKGYKAK